MMVLRCMGFLAWFSKRWGYIMLVYTELNFILSIHTFLFCAPQPVVAPGSVQVVYEARTVNFPS